MRTLLLILLFLAVAALARPSPDDELVCPPGCVHEGDHKLAQQELFDARGEAERVRNILRHGGAQDKGDKSNGRKRYSAQDLMVGLLQEAGKAAKSDLCGSCVSRICQDRDFAAYFDHKTEVLVRDGSHAHSCTGCECAVSQVAGLLVSLHDVTKMSRVVTKSYPTYVVVEDNLLHSGSKTPAEDEDLPLHTAFERELDDDTDACVPSAKGEDGNTPLKVKEANLGNVSTVVYIADLNDHDNTVGRISIYILHH